jgi:CTP synthase (UTP-ammonia lyase)
MTFAVTALLDLPPSHDSHGATLAALGHAARAAGRDLQVHVMRTSAWDGDAGRLGAGVVVGPGSPYEDEEAAYDVIRLARTAGLPLVGT